MSSGAQKMFSSMSAIAHDKPIKKVFELTTGIIYPIHSIARVSSAHQSVIVESERFKYYLPSQYKNIEIVDIDKSDNYGFCVDKCILLKNGLYTAQLSFYQNNEKIESEQQE